MRKPPEILYFFSTSRTMIVRFQSRFWFPFVASLLGSCVVIQRRPLLLVVAAAAPCIDKEPPVVSCPGDIRLIGEHPKLPRVGLHRPWSSDDCGGITWSQKPKAGTVLTWGKSYDVNVTVSDATNKTDSCLWTVTVPKVVAGSSGRARILKGKNLLTLKAPELQGRGVVVGLKYRLLNGNLGDGSIKLYAVVDGDRLGPIVHKSGTGARRPIRGYFDEFMPFMSGSSLEFQVQSTGVRAANSVRVTVLIQKYW